MRRALGAWVVVQLCVALVACTTTGTSSPDLVIGSTTTTQATALPAPTVITAPPTTAAPVVLGAGGGSGPVGGSLKGSDGRAYGAAIPFNSSIAVPSGLQFVLVVGSDARPREDIRRTNADSIHLLAVNPATMEGTIVGFPRDAWVEIPGRGTGKLTSTLQQGGPGLLIDTVRRLTGLPINFYVLTGFDGLSAMVDALGGVDVQVTRRMNDRFSGAFFEAGWHHFSGGHALAFTRNRHDTTNGDFGRSENQGLLMLAAMGKIRSEVGDDVGLRRWVDVLTRHASLEVSLDRILPLAALGRRLDPARMRNVVVPGRIGFAGRQSVVYLTAEAAGLFTDLRDDAVIGGPTTAPPPTPAAGATTTTTAAPATTTPTTASLLAPLLGGGTPPTTTPGSPPTLLPPINLFPPPKP